MQVHVTMKPIAWVVGTHLHLASGVGSIPHQAMLVLPIMVHPIIVGSPGEQVFLKAVGTEGLSEEQWAIKLPQSWLLERVHF